MSELATPELQQAIEQWYYREARMLDGREYQKWLALCTEDIAYVMPHRVNPLIDNSLRGKEEMISVERELDGVDSDGCPIRNESYVYLALRVERSYKPNSWAENPPARTRRIVGDVEVLGIEGERTSVTSNFQLFYSRPGSANRSPDPGPLPVDAQSTGSAAAAVWPATRPKKVQSATAMPLL
jgi:3-phenylpropionate/cinnamic acid dioxygenase small subunit